MNLFIALVALYFLTKDLPPGFERPGLRRWWLVGLLAYAGLIVIADLLP